MSTMWGRILMVGFCLVLVITLCEGAKRQGVKFKGMKQFPSTRKSRFEYLDQNDQHYKKGRSMCPEAYPHPFVNLTYCCVHINKTDSCTPGYLEYYSALSCCNDSIPCPKPPCVMSKAGWRSSTIDGYLITVKNDFYIVSSDPQVETPEVPSPPAEWADMGAFYSWEIEGGTLICGGQTGVVADVIDTCYKLTNNMEWVAMPSLLQRRYSAASCLIGGVPWLTGGRNPASDFLSTTEYFDVEDNEWKPGPNLVGIRALHAIQTISDTQAVLAGGYDGPFTLTTMTELLDVGTEPKSVVNYPGGPIDIGRKGASMAKVTLSDGTDRLLVIEGQFLSGSWNRAAILASALPEMSAWTAFSDTNTPCVHSGLCPLGCIQNMAEKSFCFFGYNGANDDMDVYEFDSGSDTWITTDIKVQYKPPASWEDKAVAPFKLEKKICC